MHMFILTIPLFLSVYFSFFLFES